MSDDRTLLGYQQIEAKGQTLDTETLKQLRQLAEGGYPAAQNDLGWVYQNGKGVPQDDREAIKWYRKAAQQGYAIAQDNLGWMYQNGRGIPQDDAEGG
jgi:TPR repeat protein